MSKLYNEMNRILTVVNNLKNECCYPFLEKEGELLKTQICIHQLEAKDVIDGIDLKWSKKRKGSLDYSLDCDYMFKLDENFFYNKYDNNGKLKQYTDNIISIVFNYGYKEYKEMYYSTVIKQKGRKKKKDTRKIYIHSDISKTDYDKLDYSLGIVGDEFVQAVVVNQEFDVLEDMGKIEALCFSTKGINLIYNDDYTKYSFKVDNTKLKSIYSTKELREILYKDGFYCNGIHFVRFKRSGGSARVGKCLFINEVYAKEMEEWALMGLEISENDEVDLASLEAYISLTSSGIIDTMEIKPNEILVIKDYESKFKEECVVSEIVNGELITKKKFADVSNSIFDGESMIDESKFIENGYADKGVLLTRNRFWKSAGFNCKIQKFFKDNNITLDDIKNSEAYIYTKAEKIEDIKVITTPSSIKFVKFGKLEDWLNRIDSVFGIVKYDKETHYLDGKLVQSHYQLINTIQFDDKSMKEFLKPTLDYIKLMKDDMNVFRKQIKSNTSLNEELYDNSTQSFMYYMIGANDKFANTEMYKEFLKDNNDAYINNVKQGHVLIEGNYSVLCGNPIEMLKYACGIWDGNSCIPSDNACSIRFENRKRLLGTRSPHVACGNIWLFTNNQNEEILTYMNATPQILYVNSINNNLLMRLSGADFDIDSIAITDNKILIEKAEINYDKFLVPTNNAEAKKIKRKYFYEDKADLDVKTGCNKIGEIVNLSQILNSLMWDLINKKGRGIIKCTEDKVESLVEELYIDSCALGNMSGIEIDSAKKEFDIDMNYELNRIRDKWLIRQKDKNEKDRVLLPLFFKNIKEKSSVNNYLYKQYATSMDMLLKNLKVDMKNYQKTIPLNEIFIGIDNTHKPNYKIIEKVIDAMYTTNNMIKAFYMDNLDSTEMLILKKGLLNKMYNELSNIKLTSTDIVFIISKISKANSKLKQNLTDVDKKYLSCQRFLISQIFILYNNEFISMLKQQKTNNCKIVDENNLKNKEILREYTIYGHKYYLIS